MEPWPEVSLCSSHMWVRANLCVKFVLNCMELTILRQQYMYVALTFSCSIILPNRQQYLHAVRIFAFYLALEKLLNCMRLIVHYLTND